MRIEPLRDQVVLKLRAAQEGGVVIVVVGAQEPVVRQGEVVAVGPECRDVGVGQVVLVNLLVASQIGESYLVPEPYILGSIQ